MVKVGLFIFGMVLLFSFVGVVSSVSVEENKNFCSNVQMRESFFFPSLDDNYPYSAECGIYVEYENRYDCGTCGEGDCIQGRCYTLDELGSCVPYNNPNKKNTEACSNLADNCGVSININPEEEGNPLYCGWENYQIYKPRFYWEKLDGLGSPKVGHYYLSITEDMLLNFEDINIPMRMMVKNPFITPGMKVSLNIWVRTGEPYGIIVIETGPFIAKEAGFLEGKINITGEFLEKIHYDGFSQLELTPIDPETGDHLKILSTGIRLEDHYVAVYPSTQLLILQSDKGECKGEIDCSSLLIRSEDSCMELRYEFDVDCFWDNSTSSCKGDEKISCGIIEIEETCNTLAASNCSWRENSIWGRFKSWFKNLFS